MASRDYEEFIASLNAHGVRYLIVGAHAVALHARPRATQDLDILLEPTVANARKTLAALRDFFGGADPGYTLADISDPRSILQLGVAPVRVDLLSAITGIPDFKAAWRKRIAAPFGPINANYLGFEDLVRSKEAAGRPQDLADVHSLLWVKRHRKRKRRLRRRP